MVTNAPTTASSPTAGERRTPARMALGGALLLLVLSIFVLFRSGIELLVDNSEHVLTAARTGLSPLPLLVHFQSNATLAVSPSPVLLALAGGAGAAGYIALVLVAVFAGLVCAVVAGRRHDSAAVAALAAAIIVPALLIGIGADLRLLTGCAGMLFIAASAIAFLNAPGHAAVRAAGWMLIALYLTWSLTRQTVLLAGMCGAFAALFTEGGSINRRRIVFAMGVMLPVLLAAMAAPHLPAYPEKGHVVPGYGVVDSLRPLLGSEPPTMFVNRSRLRALWTFPAMSLFCGSLLVAILLASTRRSYALAGVAAVLGGVAVLDGASMSVGASQLAPLQGATRLFPEQLYLPLISDTIVFGALVLAVAVLRARAAMPIALGTMTVILTLLVRGDGLTTTSALAARSRDSAPWRAAALAGNERVASTPSYFVLHSSQWSGACPTAEVQYVSPASLGLTFDASARADLLPLATDGDLKTRWSPSTGRQLGSDWVLLSLPPDVDLRSLRLRTGAFFSDFPRSVRIIGRNRCDAGETLFELVIDPWEGELRCTKAGLPYYGEQNDVTIAIPAGARPGCIKVAAEGRTDRFDWSIAEIELGLASQPL